MNIFNTGLPDGSFVCVSRCMGECALIFKFCTVREK